MTEYEKMSNICDFTFKRKRIDDYQLNICKKPKLTTINSFNQQNQQRNHEYDIGDIVEIKDELPSLYIQNSNIEIKNSESDKLIAIGNIKNINKSIKKDIIEKKNTLENHDISKEINDKSETNIDNLQPNSNNQIMLYTGNKLPRYSSYPERTYIVNLDKELFEKLDPFRKLIDFFNEMNIEEKKNFGKQCREHGRLLGMVDKFSDKMKSQLMTMAYKIEQEKKTTPKINSENLQNVFEEYKLNGAKKMIQEHTTGIENINKIEDLVIRGSSSNSGCEKIVEICKKTSNNDNKLMIELSPFETSSSIKAIEYPKERVERKINPNFKKHIHEEVFEFEKAMDNLNIQTKHLKKDFNNDGRLMHDRIFQNYLPIVETNY